LSKTIHNDLVYANASSWSWWTALSAYDYKDGLIYVDKSTRNGNFYPSKMLWAFGNYARFIRPNAVRIVASINADAKCLVSAYKNTDKKIVVVIINTENHIVDINLLIKNQKIETIKTYSTSASNDLKASTTLKKPKFIRISPHSIITLVINSR
jgi:O-glycosyl hydrolase